MCIHSYKLIKLYYHFQLDVYEGLYSDYIGEFLRVFPKDRVHVVRNEEYEKHPLLELNKIFKFLGVG